MLPLFHREVYHIWLNFLQVLHNQADQANFEQVQRYFYDVVMGLDDGEIEPIYLSRWRSLQTELHRLVRLLETDWLFCGSARQSSTREKRLQGFRGRIEKIMEYCRILVQESEYFL
jgi:hypothetical protein